MKKLVNALPVDMPPPYYIPIQLVWKVESDKSSGAKQVTDTSTRVRPDAPLAWRVRVPAREPV